MNSESKVILNLRTEFEIYDALVPGFDNATFRGLLNETFLQPSTMTMQTSAASTQDASEIGDFATTITTPNSVSSAQQTSQNVNASPTTPSSSTGWLIALVVGCVLVVVVFVALVATYVWRKRKVSSETVAAVPMQTSEYGRVAPALYGESSFSNI